MKRLLMVAMLVFTFCNVTLAVTYACYCFDRSGASCSGKYCRFDSAGRCECQDVPFAAFAEVESGAY
jgi:hypothetical protein